MQYWVRYGWGRIDIFGMVGGTSECSAKYLRSLFGDVSQTGKCAWEGLGELLIVILFEILNTM